MRHVILCVAVAGSLGMQPACRHSAKEQPDSARARATATPDSAPAFKAVNPELSALPARDSVGAHAVHWTVPLVMARLSSAHLAPKVMGSVTVKHMSVPGTLITVPGADLELYLYGDANAAGQDIDRFDRLMAMPGAAPVMWVKPPAIVTADNMVIVVLTIDSALRERVRTLFTLQHVHRFPGSAQ